MVRPRSVFAHLPGPFQLLTLLFLEVFLDEVFQDVDDLGIDCSLFKFRDFFQCLVKLVWQSQGKVCHDIIIIPN